MVAQTVPSSLWRPIQCWGSVSVYNSPQFPHNSACLPSLRGPFACRPNLSLSCRTTLRNTNHMHHPYFDVGWGWCMPCNPNPGCESPRQRRVALVVCCSVFYSVVFAPSSSRVIGGQEEEEFWSLVVVKGKFPCLGGICRFVENKQKTKEENPHGPPCSYLHSPARSKVKDPEQSVGAEKILERSRPPEERLQHHSESEREEGDLVWTTETKDRDNSSERAE